MRKFLAFAAVASMTVLSTAALAEDVAAAAPAAGAFVPRSGQMLFSSDGKRIGRIDRVDAQRVSVIADMRLVYIPRATLSAGEKGRAVTSLTAAEARK